MVEASLDHSIAIPVDWSSDRGCAGWSQFGNKLLDVLVEHDIIFTDYLASREAATADEQMKCKKSNREVYL